MTNPVEEYLTNQNISFNQIELPVEAGELTEIPLEHEKIYKTLVLKGDKTGVVVAVVPFDGRLDYKKAAQASGNRKIGFPPMDFVLAHTGYPHGANTPIGIQLQHPDYQILIDASLEQKKSVIISSGELGRAVEIAAEDLINLLQSPVVDLLSN